MLQFASSPRSGRRGDAAVGAPTSGAAGVGRAPGARSAASTPGRITPLHRRGNPTVAELDGAGTLVYVFVYASNSNTPDLVVRDGATYRLLTDHVGSVVRAINVANSSDVPFAAEYTAFGEQTVTVGSPDFVPFGFAGGLWDAETGLVHFGARDYDPLMGGGSARIRSFSTAGRPTCTSTAATTP